MAQFTIDIPDELLPALAAEFAIVWCKAARGHDTAEEYFAGSVVETVRQRAEIYKVGPYYTGPIPPQFNADGTPYIAPAEPEPEEPAAPEEE
jgi:hypothetical protein